MTLCDLPTKVMCGVTVPDTPVINSALTFARSNLTDRIYNHVVRSFLFGFIIAGKMPHTRVRDEEAHAVAALLHDLGLPLDHRSHHAMISMDKRFEVDGANAAREFLRRHTEVQHWDRHRVQLVWDAVALHATGSIVFHKEPEVQACAHGIWADFQGPDRVTGGLLTWEEYDAVVREYPRLDLMHGFKESMLCLCRMKPQTTYDNTVGEWGARYLSTDEYDRGQSNVQRMLEKCADLDERER